MPTSQSFGRNQYISDRLFALKSKIVVRKAEINICNWLKHMILLKLYQIPDKKGQIFSNTSNVSYITIDILWRAVQRVVSKNRVRNGNSVDMLKSTCLPNVIFSEENKKKRKLQSENAFSSAFAARI